MGLRVDLEVSDIDGNEWNKIELGIIPAAAVDENGRAVAPESALLELPVNDTVRRVLTNGGKFRIRVGLDPGGRSGPVSIMISPEDTFEYKIWADLRLKVNQ